MNTKLKLIKKDRPECVPKRSNFPSIDGGNVPVSVQCRKFQATAISQTQGYGANAKRHARAI